MVPAAVGPAPVFSGHETHRSGHAVAIDGAASAEPAPDTYLVAGSVNLSARHLTRLCPEEVSLGSTAYQRRFGTTRQGA
ncbi:hypothetical protein [Kutzneria sp. NPDC051319]|uniref:hypothetical protein n=1 Tax=Kutzneria sp. NPDC051319 TaxID=3155047 RepID=UPI00344667E8